MSQPTEQPGLFIGIDWADRKHECYVIDRNGKGFHQELSQSAEDIDGWVGQTLKLADGISQSYLNSSVPYGSSHDC